ncbi:outer membrane protein assembly factor BamE [Limnobacter sp.]|uniref:outer membrane protein assembly factor BamE n=1 Tax=Limnobacter sp. TaxID=2003368 RepID=UPI0027B88AA7|nr:outer membrane protein assembly factor BamE [Limnobacter sp.]
MSTFDRVGTSRFIKTAALALSVTVLAACGSITGIKDIPEYLDSDFEHVGPRDFITNIDLARIKLGMSPLQVQNRLGMPMLSAKDQDDRWDYVLKKGQGASEEFVPYAVYFKDQKVVRLAPLTPPPAPVVEAPAEAPAVDASAVAAPEASAGEVMAPEPSLAVGADVGDAAAINDMLSNWAAAWSSKDVQGYLGFYADTFEHGKKSRAAWEGQRRARLSDKETISVSVSDVQIDVQSEALATVKFKQDYSSNRYNDSGIKVLTLSKASGAWKIQREEFQK